MHGAWRVCFSGRIRCSPSCVLSNTQSRSHTHACGKLNPASHNPTHRNSCKLFVQWQCRAAHDQQSSHCWNRHPILKWVKTAFLKTCVSSETVLFGVFTPGGWLQSCGRTDDLQHIDEQQETTPGKPEAIFYIVAQNASLLHPNLQNQNLSQILSSRISNSTMRTFQIEVHSRGTLNSSVTTGCHRSRKCLQFTGIFGVLFLNVKSNTFRALGTQCCTVLGRPYFFP